MKTFIVVFILLFFPLQVLATDKEKDLLDSLVKEALMNSPLLKSMEFAIEESEHRIPQSGALPDPVISVGVVNESLDEFFTVGKMQMSKSDFGVKQMLPFPGKLKLKTDMATYDTKKLKKGYEQKRLELVSMVRVMYYDLYGLQQEISLLELKLKYLDVLEQTATSLYSTGERSVNDVLMVQTQKYETIEMLEKLRGNLKKTEATLCQIIGRGKCDKFPEIEIVTLHQFYYKEDALMKYALDNSKELDMLKLEIAGAGKNVELMKKEVFPDVEIMANYSARFSDEFLDMWEVYLSFPVPIFYEQKQKHGILEAKSNVSKLTKDYEELSLKVKSMVISEMAQIEASDRIIALYREGLLEKARLSADTAVTSYRNNTSGIESVIKTINTVINYERKHVEAIMERERAIANIYVITGGLAG
ncbi:MAG: TolC family protein [Candidatus Magnetoovum sp. WYHC-5]|nr:TolC family protein [Candidatus Magnetoovum sp. WYHC-5]